MMNKNQGLIYSNLEINPGKAYILYIGDVKYIDTTTLLLGRLVKRYNKPVETINILPNLPPQYMTGNFIVINTALVNHISQNSKQKYFLPLDQADVNRDASNNPYIKKTINEILKSQEDIYINLFKNTPEMTLTDDERIKVIGPSSDIFTYFDNKINQRKIIEQLEIPVAKGYIANSFDELIIKYQTNFQDKAFVSCSNGFGGNGTEKILSLDNLLTSEKLKGKNQFIISELLSLKSSLCAINIVANSNEVMFVSVSDQLMDNVTYMGNIYPSIMGNENFQKIKDYSLKIGRFLGSKGYKGIIGIDFMIDKENNLYFTEINPRKVGHTPEMIFAYHSANPYLPSLSELEFLAVSEGTFGMDISQYNVPQTQWGVLSIKARKGQRTANYIPRNPKERILFNNSGITVLDHPGNGITYLRDGKLARIVCVLGIEPHINHKELILNQLRKKEKEVMLE